MYKLIAIVKIVFKKATAAAVVEIEEDGVMSDDIILISIITVVAVYSVYHARMHRRGETKRHFL